MSSYLGNRYMCLKLSMAIKGKSSLDLPKWWRGCANLIPSAIRKLTFSENKMNSFKQQKRIGYRNWNMWDSEGEIMLQSVCVVWPLLSNTANIETYSYPEGKIILESVSVTSLIGYPLSKLLSLGLNIRSYISANNLESQTRSSVVTRFLTGF